MELVSSQDPVTRLEQFRAAHPEVDVMTPVETRSPFWKAYRDGRQLTVQHNLASFVDVLSVMADQDEL